MGSRSFVHRWTSAMWGLSLAFLILYFAVAIISTLVAVADVLLGLGWGYQLPDVWFGLGLLAFGAFFYLVLRLVFGIVRGLNNRFYGPDEQR